MKHIIFGLAFTALFSACKDELAQDVDFTVSVASADGLVLTDTLITAPKGTTVHFDFTGEPDFISFSYRRFIPSNVTLGFAAYASWGTHIENTLSLFVSEEFRGLQPDDFVADSTALAGTAWVDLTDSCNLPATANAEKQTAFSLNDYKGKTITLAFRYKTEYAEDWQPGWEIRNLKIDNSLITDGSVFSTFPAVNLGFSPFDILNPANPYASDATSGVWIAAEPTKLEIKRTARNNPLNIDWLISKPFTIPPGMEEASAVVPVKNISSYVYSYEHTFDKTGTYTLIFKAFNHNYKYRSSVERTIVMRITE